MTRREIASIMMKTARTRGNRRVLIGFQDFFRAASAIVDESLSKICPLCSQENSMSYGDGRICLSCGTKWEFGKVTWIPQKMDCATEVYRVNDRKE